MFPKFSIRQMLVVMIVIGVISACMAGASRGNRVAFGLSIAIIGSILPFAVFAVVHWFSFALASVLELVFKQHVEPVKKTTGDVSLALEQGVDSPEREIKPEFVEHSEPAGPGDA